MARYSIYKMEDVESFIQPILSVQWKLDEDSPTLKKSHQSIKEDFLNFLNDVFSWSLIELGADTRNGKALIEQLNELNLELKNHASIENSIQTLLNLKSFAQTKILSDNPIQLQKFFDVIEEVFIHNEKATQYTKKIINNINKKGRPNLQNLKNQIEELAGYYNIFSGRKQKILRHKEYSGAYSEVTNWHIFCSQIIKKIQPYLTSRVTEKQIITACEYVIKRYNQIHPDIIE